MIHRYVFHNDQLLPIEKVRLVERLKVLSYPLFPRSRSYDTEPS